MCYPDDGLLRFHPQLVLGVPRDHGRGGRHCRLRIVADHVGDGGDLVEQVLLVQGHHLVERIVQRKEATAAIPVKTEGTQSVTEQDFYDSFAGWLEENDEATIASALGGSSFGGKWGTPDVIGVLKPRVQDIFKFEPQIITAEIKAVPGQPVVAFGQAVAYRLFCHKSYIVVPNTTSSDDMNRLKALCGLHGVSLVIFTLNVTQPDYVVVVLPTVASPDMFYVNTMLERLKSSEPELLNKLF